LTCAAHLANSSLLICFQEMEDVHFNAEDEMDDDDEDEDEDVEMDFGEETGSEDTSNTEEEGEDPLDNATQQSGDGWQDEDEEDEDLVANEDENEPDEDEDEEEDADEEEEEMMWQVTRLIFHCALLDLTLGVSSGHSSGS
jgi:E3 ubiquitin-protein ligase HUWE1